MNGWLVDAERVFSSHRVFMGNKIDLNIPNKTQNGVFP